MDPKKQKEDVIEEVEPGVFEVLEGRAAANKKALQEKRQGAPTVYSEGEVAAALLKAGGWISRAGAILGCSARTVKRYIDESELCQEAWLETLEARKDAVEIALLENAKSGNPLSQIFWLKMNARDRGYVENAPPPQQAQVIAIISKTMPIDEI